MMQTDSAHPAQKLCPVRVPWNMYEVVGSDWLREIRPQGEGYKHYLMVGHDAYVEVIAMGWRWESIRALEGW